MRWKKRRLYPGIVLMLCVLMLGPGTAKETVYAADVTVKFGSNWYDKENDDTFPIGVYIQTERGTGDFHVTIQYNPLRLEYVSGANAVDEEAGILTLEGTDGDEEIKYWLTFHAISGGDTELAVDAVEVFVPDGDEIYEIAEKQTAPIHIEGEDTALAEEERLAEEARQAEEEQQQQEAAQETQTMEPQSSQTDDNADVSDDAQTRPAHKSIVFNAFFFLVLVAVVLVVVLDVIIWLIVKRVRRRRKATGEPDEMEILDMDHFEEQLSREIVSMMDDSSKEKQLGKPIIQVCDVTMEFHLASSNPSGLKEYVIQMLKREISYRKLYALYHVSFNVYKGEVVGIIGTNGSGKSTLLKIISGALKPTEGHVAVDRRKIQILTLGTGFDMELTARENVFLNGAIIGYSKEFLESHYDEIVEFAELGDFMEEKVKNFSSGMVSRLGFAIATAGDAAEILILDEVLSVGDEFFRQKSLKRIKEMIHGGSTVLMVSHGMGTILDNCTKCVWIEKGELRMIGEPKVVCGEYRKMKVE